MTIKKYIFRKWLHAKPIDACCVCKRKIFLIILLKILLLQKGMFVENGYMQGTSIHVRFVIDKDCLLITY